MLNAPLGRAAILLTMAQLLHDLDHVRQGRTASVEVSVVAIAAWVVTIVMLVLVARRSRHAPLFCLTFGVSVAIGIVLVHGLPPWGVFSASYADWHVDALSWALAAVPVAAGLWLAATGARELRGERRMEPSGPTAAATVR